MNRIKELRETRGIGQKEFAIDIGVAQPTVSNWETGLKEPSTKNAKRIALYFNVSVDYLLGGSIPEQQKTPATVISNERITSTFSPTAPGSQWIPVLGSIAAGIPLEAIEFRSEDPDDWEEIPAKLARSGEHFALRINGHSMEPKMSIGDVVIVRRQEDVDDGDIAVVIVNGNEATVKKIKKESGGIRLIPLNPAFDSQFFSIEDISTLPVRILGKVVELRAKF